MTIQTNDNNMIIDQESTRRMGGRGLLLGKETEEDLLLPSTKLPFVWKLYEMLEGVENCGNDYIVSWVESGKAFKVHQHQKFLKNIIPIYFKQKQYKSFQRQLNYYGFTRITHGPNMGAYYHPKFIKDSKFLCLSIRPMNSRKKVYAMTTTKKKFSKNDDNNNHHGHHDTSWKIQLKLILEKGADYALKEMEERENSITRRTSDSREKEEKEEEEEEEEEENKEEGNFALCDGDPVFVFDDMLFYAVV